ncbi:hypothetical protein PGB90_006304 [Kerria lacca]
MQTISILDLSNFQITEIDFNNNHEEHNKFIRAIRNLENLFGIQIFDNEEFYDPPELDDKDYDSDYNSNIGNYFNINSDNYNSNDLLSYLEINKLCQHQIQNHCATSVEFYLKTNLLKTARVLQIIKNLMGQNLDDDDLLFITN